MKTWILTMTALAALLGGCGGGSTPPMRNDVGDVDIGGSDIGDADTGGVDVGDAGPDDVGPGEPARRLLPERLELGDSDENRFLNPDFFPTSYSWFPVENCAIARYPGAYGPTGMAVLRLGTSSSSYGCGVMDYVRGGKAPYEVWVWAGRASFAASVDNGLYVTFLTAGREGEQFYELVSDETPEVSLNGIVWRRFSAMLPASLGFGLAILTNMDSTPLYISAPTAVAGAQTSPLAMRHGVVPPVVEGREAAEHERAWVKEAMARLRR